MKSSYEDLAKDWDLLTNEYLESLTVLRASTHNVLSLAWLTYKTREACLIRQHGWTVLEFENVGRVGTIRRISPPPPYQFNNGMNRWL